MRRNPIYVKQQCQFCDVSNPNNKGWFICRMCSARGWYEVLWLGGKNYPPDLRCIYPYPHSKINPVEVAVEKFKRDLASGKIERMEKEKNRIFLEEQSRLILMEELKRIFLEKQSQQGGK